MRTFIARQRPRNWVIAGVLAVLIVGASVYWFAFAVPSTAGAATTTTRIVTVSAQTLQKTVSGTGTLTPTVDEDVNFGAAGTVTSVAVKAGETVKAGQTLATIDTLTVNANLLDAKAALASAQAKLSDAESSSDGSSTATAQIAADQAAVEVAQAAVTSAQAAVSATTLAAPVSGLVAAVEVAVGDTVSASGNASASTGSSATGGSASTGGSGTSGGSGSTGATSSSSSSSSSSAAFTIVGTTSWEVTVPVSASSIKNVKAGEQVELSTTENASFFGTVASIGLLPTTTSGAATYPVVVTVTGSPTDLYDGVSVTANIVYQRVTDALTVPSAAVTTTKSGTSTVTKVVNGKNVTTTVTVGETVGQLTQITKGLASGDQVVVRVTLPPTSGGTGSTGTNRQGGFVPGSGQFPGGGFGGTGGTRGGTGGTTGGGATLNGGGKNG